VSLGGVNSSARAINDYGVVVGNAQLPNGRDHAFMWQSGTVTDLGTLGGGYSQCVSVNSHGAVTGRSELALGGSHAYIWQNGVMQDLGAFGSDSDAFDVNDDNVVVGTSGYRAFIWRGGAMEDLNSLVNLPSGWVLVQARAVNNSGAIVGWGEHQFKKKAFLLLPYGPVPTKTSTWGELKARYR
jgi:probable HAF family extracellular repeat protein